jgi:hypothetical protein
MGDQTSNDDQAEAKQGKLDSSILAKPANQIQVATPEETARAAQQKITQHVAQPWRGWEYMKRGWARIKNPESTNLIMAIATVVIAIFTALTFYVVLDSSSDTQKLITAAQTQAVAASDQADAAQQFSDTTEDINGDINGAVDQLQAAADNARASIEATQDAMRLDQRAWVATSGIASTPKLEVKNGRDFLIQIVFRNTGKTPARKSTFLTFWDLVPKGTKPTLAVRGVPSISQVLVAPNAEYRKDIKPFQEPFDAINNLSTMKPEEKEAAKRMFIEQFTSRTMVLYVHGRADYRDIFGCPHWTTFCSYLEFDADQAASMTVCSEHNETDENACVFPKKAAKPN